MASLADLQLAYLEADIAAIDKQAQLRSARVAYQSTLKTREEWLAKLRQAHAGTLVLDTNAAWSAVAAADAAMHSQEASIRILRQEVYAKITALKNALAALRSAEGLGPMSEDAPGATIDSLRLDRSLEINGVLKADDDGLNVHGDLDIGGEAGVYGHMAVGGDVAIGGDIAVTGSSSVASLAVTNGATVGGALSVDGSMTIKGGIVLL